MKARLLLSILLLCSLSTVSCKKEKGCTDPSSLNYSTSAKVDDGSCIYPADKLVGSWNVAETVSGNTVHFPATITKDDNTQITIAATRPNPPNPYMNTFTVLVNWTEMKIERPGTFIEGTITDENDFEVNYVYGVGANLIYVDQHYTR